jgi:hypothetical protein
MTSELAPLSIREKIGMLEAEMLKLPQVHIPVKHYFAEGIYAREILIPKGTLVTGRLHRHESIDVVSRGEMSVVNDKGEAGRIVAPCTRFSPPGVKKAGFAIEDTLWTSIHANPTNERDIEAIERAIYDDPPEDLARFRIERDREDYRKMLAEYGFTHETARAQSEYEGDQTAILMDAHGIMLAASPIEGHGIFATGSIPAGTIVAPARVSGKRTQVGRYTNHSTKPNAIMVLRSDGDIDLIATLNINHEEITIDYRESLKLAGLRAIKEGSLCLE